jgi:hypothetical protein
MTRNSDTDFMATDKKRAWFQIHLSTAVVLMISAAMVLWLNLRNSSPVSREQYGWPFNFWYVSDIGGGHLAYPGNLLTDVLIWIGLLAGLTVALEFLMSGRYGPSRRDAGN